MSPLPDHVLTHLQAPSGSLNFMIGFPEPVAEPDETLLMGEVAVAGLIVRLELTPEMRLRHTRLNLLTGVRTVELDATELIGTNVWEIFLGWDVDDLSLYVRDAAGEGPIISSG